MVLLGVKADGAWLVSRWKLTYRIGWVHICKAVRSAFSDFSNAEILVDQNPVEISNRDDILKLEECGSMVIRGTSGIMKSRVMITFYNQLQFVTFTWSALLMSLWKLIIRNSICHLVSIWIVLRLRCTVKSFSCPSAQYEQRFSF